jgi:glycerol uptake facilitator-like aquaporin
MAAAAADLSRRAAAEALGTALLLAAVVGPISGAHFNPAVTLADAAQGALAWRDVAPYVAAQTAGAFAGVAVAHVMFGSPLFFASQHARAGAAQCVSEVVATFGLVIAIRGCASRRPRLVPFAVGAYITAAYWFTSSTSFANPP